MKILITGPTGSGKTTLANVLSPLIGAVVFDGDVIRDSYKEALGLDLGWTHEARTRHACHMATLCDAVTAAGTHAIASFICPTFLQRNAFAADFTIWIDANGDQRYPGSTWVDPEHFDLRVTRNKPPEFWAAAAADIIQPVFMPMHKTALFVGRYHPFHAGHKALIEEGIRQHGQVCIGVRDNNREWPFHRVKQSIDAAMRKHIGKYTVISLPNITAICYGRDVGYEVQRLTLPVEIEEISGTKIRELTCVH